MTIKQTLTEQRVPVRIWTGVIDERSKEQQSNIALLPFIHLTVDEIYCTEGGKP